MSVCLQPSYYGLSHAYVYIKYKHCKHIAGIEPMAHTNILSLQEEYKDNIKYTLMQKLISWNLLNVSWRNITPGRYDKIRYIDL